MPTTDENTPELILQGVVRYTLKIDDSGAESFDVKWVSTRTLKFKETGTGHAFRKGGAVGGGWEGDWEIKYFEPDGNLAVRAFALNIELQGEIYHAKWATLDGKLLLSGFGFEDNNSLYMRYGS